MNIGGMNGTEQLYFERLFLQKHDGVIKIFKYEPTKFKLAHRCTYTPDFRVVLPDGTIEYHEVKRRTPKWSSMRDDANVKLKVAATLFPEFRFWLAEYWGEPKGWIVKLVPRATPEIIPLYR